MKPGTGSDLACTCPGAALPKVPLPGGQICCHGDRSWYAKPSQLGEILKNTGCLLTHAYQMALQSFTKIITVGKNQQENVANKEGTD